MQAKVGKQIIQRSGRRTAPWSIPPARLYDEEKPL